MLVAYSMGLGKTVIGIAAAERLLDDGKINRCLVVCPASLKYQWAERVEWFSDSKSVVIDGSAEARRKQFADVASSPDVRYIIMSYDIAVRDASSVASLVSGGRCMVVLDEATAIKTFRAQRTKAIKKVLRAPYRMALTGTPVENRPDELFSIMQWVDDTVLGRYDLFDKAYINRNKFGWVASYKNLPVLRKRIAPALARKSRKDPDVRDYLPHVDEDVWYVEADDKTMHLYKIIATAMLNELSKLASFSDFSMDNYYKGVDESRPSGKLMAMYMCMEMLLDHPDLIIYSGMLYEAGDGQGSRFAYDLWQQGLLDDILVSPKIDYLTEKVQEILQFDDGKILVFSKYRNMLEVMERRLAEEGIRTVKFHGELNPRQKADVIAEYTNDPECRVLLSSYAGAYGMDMYMANYLIKMDLPWSAGTDDQIDSRHVRASSEFDKVYVRNIVVRGSMEERKLRILDRKKRVAGAILDGTGNDIFGRVTVDGDSLKAHLTEVTTDGHAP